MTLNIHFFRKNSLGKIDYTKILEYFETVPNFKIYYSEADVEMKYHDHEFDLEYRFVITKQSQVVRIYELNPMYTNINFMLEMPLLIPSFLAREILTLVQKICKLFDLEIYHNEVRDVTSFNLVDLLVLFEKNRSSYLESNFVNNKILYDSDKLNVICKYQRSIASLEEYYNNSVDVGLALPILDENAGLSGISYSWELGKAAIFPPYIDYIYVKTEEETILVPRESLYRILSKYFIEIKTVLPDLYIIKEKQARKTKREYKAIRRLQIANHKFKKLHLCDVIDK